MSAPKPNPEQAKFIAGMKAPGMDSDELNRRLNEYLKHEARLDDIVRHQIFRKPGIKPKAKLDQLVRTYKPGRPAEYEKSEARELVEQVSDLLDDIGGAIEQFEKAEKLFVAQKELGTRDSLVFKTAEECVAHLSKSGAELKKTVKSVRVPKADGKPEATVKEVYATASVLIAAAMLAAEVSKAIVKWHEQLKKAAA